MGQAGEAEGDERLLTRGNRGGGPPTTGSLLEAATERLARTGFDGARLDAELLLAHATDSTRTSLLARLRETVSAAARRRFAELVARRAAGEPVAYIRGVREFRSMPLVVAPGVLVPRPETEHLVEEALARVRTVRRPRVLDLGTGSGAIACAIARDRRDARVLATDISSRALEVARRNVANLGLEDRVRLARGDGSGVVRPEGALDLLVSNPPYVAPTEREILAPAVRDHEPGVALFDEAPDGLGLTRRIVRTAPDLLGPGGHLLLEVGAGRADAVRELCRRGPFEAVRAVDDLAGIPRVVVARRRSREA